MFEKTWRNKFLTLDAKSIDDMVVKLRAAADQLEVMAKDGVTLAGGQEDDYARLVTTDAKVARKHRMRREDYHEHGGEG